MTRNEERNELEQPVANLEVFGVPIAMAAKALTERMGKLSTEGVSSQDLDWMARVSGLAEAIMGPLEELFAAINDAPYEATIQEDEGSKLEEVVDNSEAGQDSQATVEYVASSLEETHRLRSAVGFLEKKSHVGIKGGVHIRRVVESVFGNRRIPKEEYQQFLNQLNQVASRRGPYYFVGPDSGTTLVEQEEQAVAEVIDEVDLELEMPEVEVTQDDSEASPVVAYASNIEESTANDTAFTPREERILACIMDAAKGDGWLRQGEVDLSAIEFSSESAQRQAFGKLAIRAVEAGILIDNGIARGGKKYKVVQIYKPSNNDRTETSRVRPHTSAVETPRVNVKGTQSSPPAPVARVPFYDAQRKAAEQDMAGGSKEDSQAELTKIEERRTIRFAESIVSYVSASHLASSNGGRREKLSIIVRDLALQLGILEGEAKDIIKDLIVSGQLFINGHQKGSPLVGSSPDQEGESIEKKEPSEAETKRELELQRIRSLRDEYEKGILGYLATLKKEQTEFKTGIVAALGNDLLADDANEICNLLRTEGFLEAKAQTGKGSRRSRAGKTWKITGKGRARLRDLENRITNAEKKMLSNGLKIQI